MSSLDWICAALEVDQRVPAREASEVAAANLIDLLSPSTWQRWPDNAQSAAKLAHRYDAVAILSEIQSAFDAGELGVFISQSSHPTATRWAELIAARADRSEQASHGEGLRHPESAEALAATALDALRAYAADHPAGPPSNREDT